MNAGAGGGADGGGAVIDFEAARRSRVLREPQRGAAPAGDDSTRWLAMLWPVAPAVLAWRRGGVRATEYQINYILHRTAELRERMGADSGWTPAGVIRTAIHCGLLDPEYAPLGEDEDGLLETDERRLASISKRAIQGLFAVFEALQAFQAAEKAEARAARAKKGRRAAAPEPALPALPEHLSDLAGAVGVMPWTVATPQRAQTFCAIAREVFEASDELETRNLWASFARRAGELSKLRIRTLLLVGESGCDAEWLMERGIRRAREFLEADLRRRARGGADGGGDGDPEPGGAA